MKKTILYTVSILAICVVAFILIKPSDQNTQKNSITLGVSELRISTPVYVALSEGYFEEQGLDISLKYFDTAQPLMAALISGDISAGGYIANPIILKGMEKSQKQFHILSSLVEDTQHPVSILLIDKDKQINSIAELKGKTIGILPTAAYRIWLEQILTKNGLTVDDVVIKNVAPTFTITEFTNNGIDAAFTNDPAATAAVVANVATPFSNESLIAKNLWEPYYFGSFLVSPKLKEDSPEIAKKMVLAINKAITFIEKNPEKVQEILKNSLPLEQSKLVDSFPKSKYHTSEEFKYEEFKKVMDNFEDFGFLNQSQDYSDWILR